MSKINLEDVNSGFNLSRINQNFQTIKTHLDDKVLYRDNPVGEPNAMNNNLDMNSNRVYNLPEPISENEAARLKDVQDAIAGVDQANLIQFTPYRDVDSTNVQGAIEEVRDIIDTVSGDLEGRLALGTGASLVGSEGWGTVADAIDEIESSAKFGLKFDGTDESTIVQSIIDSDEILMVPAGKQLICKNIQLKDNSRVYIRGSVKLPNACVDFDRLFYAYDKTNVDIQIAEIDGNYVNQSGVIGTHLIYLVNCPYAYVKVDYAHDHYIHSSANLNTGDAYRNDSTGTIWLYNCSWANVSVGLLSYWSREGIYLQLCTNAEVDVGHCQGHATRNTEYSGLQVSGKGNKVLRASVDFAGASGVGFDTNNGILSNILSTRTRENHGINFGHPGNPASNSIASNLVVDGAWLLGIGVHANTSGLQIDGFSVDGAGDAGISISDGSNNISLSNGAVRRSSTYNLQAAVATVKCQNLDYNIVPPQVLFINVTSGMYALGETVSNGTATATVAKLLRNLGGNQVKLILQNLSGSFSSGQTITGVTSGATGTTTSVTVPLLISETSGGHFSGLVHAVPNGTYVEHPNGQAEYIITTTINPTADVALTQDYPFPSTVRFTGDVVAFAQLTAPSLTQGFTIRYCMASANTARIRVLLDSSYTQSYGITLMAKGFWK